MTLEEQAREYRAAKLDYEEKQRAADEAKRLKDRLHRALWDRMDATGVSGIKIDGRNFVFNKPKIYGQVTDKAAFAEWARDNAPHLIAEAPLEGRINEWVRLAVDNGEELPPGLNWYTKETVADRKA